ncbi:MAG: cytochrome ubiquinol oxidase subunit I [Thermoguttaceae bacterium]|jgi:cytochrome bd-type quinol oxidase subunit 1/mono/diheme cytochrome c family protein
MHYPWWFVPHLTSPMLIAIISVVHVLVSHYAVGGGFFLAVETGYAYRKGDHEYLAYLKKHARFFILLTIVFGAITGVGIWWTIGLASPLATAVLIRTFVFGWAIEYVAFVVELVSAFVFYYYWGRLPQKTHLIIVWIYALAAWFSLVAITCITAFMLNPGAWLEQRTFWAGMLNPQALPQTIARTGGALMLASLYVYLHASLFLRDTRLRDLIASRSARPALLGAAMITIGGATWHYFLPESARAVLATAAALNILMALIFAMTIVVFVLLYLGPYRNPGWLSPGFAITLFLFGVAAFTTGEFIREAVRKPYIVYNVVFGHQVLAEEVPELRKTGFLEGGTWTNAYVKAHYPAMVDTDGRIDERRLLTLFHKDQLVLGKVLFQYHCNDCHATEEGYSAMGRLLQGRPPEMILPLVENLHLVHYFMPPWSGTSEEAKLLTAYLVDIAPPRPKGMLPPWPAEETK